MSPLTMRKEFEFEYGVAVGNDNVTIVFSKGTRHRKQSGTCRFIFRPLAELLKGACPIRRSTRSRERIRATRSAPRHPAHRRWAYRWELSVQSGR